MPAAALPWSPPRCGRWPSARRKRRSEIKSLISTSTTQVGEGVKLVAETGKALERIVVQVAEINAVVTNIAASAQEQSTGLDQVNTAVNQMDQVTQQNAAMVEESTAASHSLSQETEELARQIGTFRLGKLAVVDAGRPASAAAGGAGTAARAEGHGVQPRRFRRARSGPGGRRLAGVLRPEMTTASDPSPQLFELPAVLDFRAATPLAEALLALRGTALTIDAARVERIGGQCLQVLLAAQKTWSADDAALCFANLAPAFVDGLRLMGIAQADLTREDVAP